MSAPSAAILELFQRSLDRCLAAPSFLPRFYERFRASSPVVAERFQATDMKKQESVLRASLYLVLRAAQGAEDGLAHLEEIARSHSARGHDITPELYSLWYDTLIAVASEHDARWTPDVALAWEACVTPFVSGMKAAYR